MSKPHLEPVKASLRDGTGVLIRPIVPEDKVYLRRGIRQVSERTLRQRCLSPIRKLSAQQLRYLTEIDYHDHMAWIAFDQVAPAQHGLGCIMYVRDREELTLAEVAVCVVDPYQGRGLGTLLFRLISVSAMENGIETFCGYALADNTQMLDAVQRRGARVMRDEGGLLKILMPVPRNAQLSGPKTKIH